MSKKTAKPKGVTKEDEESWIFDSIVGFLRGPVWNVPILTFVEHKSLIFEPEDDPANETEYKKVHEEYKNLVDFMLGSYMDDIGIKSAQFEEACNRGKKKSPLHHTLFEQVWAADDYVMFKRMMIQKNIELQLQALELLQHRYGVLPSSLQPTASESVAGKAAKKVKIVELSENEENVMKEVAKKSMEEHKKNLEAMDKEKRDLEEAMARSMDDQKRLEAQMAEQKSRLVEHVKTSLSPSSKGEAPTAPPAEPKSAVETVTDSIASTTIDPEELKKRTEFLKAQRDKLLEMKKAEREKQLAEVERQNPKSRPKSAKAARSALNRKHQAHGIDPQTLNARRALAEKLKQEVIGKSEV